VATHAEQEVPYQPAPLHDFVEGLGVALSSFFSRLERLLESEREQLPLWLPVAMLTGIGAWFTLPDPASWAAFMALAGVTGGELTIKGCVADDLRMIRLVFGRLGLLSEFDGDDLVVRVLDDGRGLPEGFDPSAGDGLGLQIVRTLVDSELGGSLTMGRPADGRSGTEVVLMLPGAGRLRR